MQSAHDRRLIQRVSRLQRIDPAAVRDAGLAVAQQGYAGQDAMAAARCISGSIGEFLAPLQTLGNTALISRSA